MIITPGITGRCGKCPGEKRLIESHVLERVNPFSGHAFENSIDLKKDTDAAIAA